MPERSRNQTIDVVRIIASFFVILCHIHFPKPIEAYSMGLARFAVPYFLLVTGWHLNRGSARQTAEAARKTLISILKMTLISVLLIAAVNTVVCLIKHKELFSWATGFFRRNGSLSLFLLYNRTHWLSSVMWYLFGLLYALVIYGILARLNALKYAYWAILPLLVLNLVRGEGLGMQWYYQGNWLFTSLPFLFLGSRLRGRDWCARISGAAAWAMIAAGILSTLLEVRAFGEQIIYISTLPLVLGIFCLAMNGGALRWSERLAYFGRRCTKYIFLLHCSLRDLVYAVTGEPSGAVLYLMPFLFFGLSGVIGWGIARLEDRHKVLQKNS